MSNLSKQKVEEALAGPRTAPTTEQCLTAENIKLQNKVLRLDNSLSEKDQRIDELKDDLEEAEEDADGAREDLEALASEVEHSTHKIFGEEVTVLSSRIDIGHFFETLAEVSKKYNPYQLEDLIRNL